MTYLPEYTGSFKKDYKLLKKRGYDLVILQKVVEELLKRGTLPAKFNPHPLRGNYNGFFQKTTHSIGHIKGRTTQQFCPSGNEKKLQLCLPTSFEEGWEGALMCHTICGVAVCVRLPVYRPAGAYLIHLQISKLPHQHINQLAH